MSNHINPQEVFVIVPAYNEQSVIREVVQELTVLQYNVVVVDDGSAQSMYPFVQGLPVFFLQHETNLGQGAALQTGVEFAREHGAVYIVTFDGDGQHNANDIDKLLQPLLNNEADFTLGSRFMEGSQHNMSSGRAKTIQLAKLINYFFTGMKLTDAYNGMRALNKTAAVNVNIVENGMAHATELLSYIKKNKLRYKEIAVSIRYTAYSKSKGLTVWSGFRIFFDILLNKIFG
jgi:glycosyltransferase involved in cell wall biosynthesis